MVTVHGAVRPGRRTKVSPRRRWCAAWAGLALLGVANGAARELTYQPYVGEHAGHQLSTVTLLLLVAGYTWLLQRRWPLLTARDALAVGVTWVGLTLAFEVGFGHYVAGTSWSALLADYDLRAGNLWLLVPLATALAPWAARRLDRRAGAGG
jgi:hypothetical protein